MDSAIPEFLDKRGSTVIFYLIIMVSICSSEPLPNIDMFTPIGFVLEQAFFNVVNMFACLNHPY